MNKKLFNGLNHNINEYMYQYDRNQVIKKQHLEPPTEHECQFKDVSFPHYLGTYTLNYYSVPTDIHKHYAIDGCLALCY